MTVFTISFLGSCLLALPRPWLEPGTHECQYASFIWSLGFLNSPTTPQCATRVWLPKEPTTFLNLKLKWNYFPAARILTNGDRRRDQQIPSLFQPSVDFSEALFFHRICPDISHTAKRVHETQERQAVSFRSSPYSSGHNSNASLCFSIFFSTSLLFSLDLYLPIND